MKKDGEKAYYIYLFRHGQTYYNKKGIFTGWLDSKLTPKGIKQAKIVAEKLKDKKFSFAFYTSLKRSMETLQYVLKHHPECKRLIKDDRIRERDYGELDGVPHEIFIKKVGRQEYDLLKHGDAIENFSLRLKKKVERFLGEQEYQLVHRGYSIPPPGGESLAMVEKRVKNFIKDLKKFIRKNKTNVAISAHSNSIRLFRKIMENASNEEIVQWFIPYDKVFTYKIRI